MTRRFNPVGRGRRCHGRPNSDAVSPLGRTTAGAGLWTKANEATDLVTAFGTATAQKSERDFFISLSLSLSLFLGF